MDCVPLHCLQIASDAMNDLTDGTPNWEEGEVAETLADATRDIPEVKEVTNVRSRKVWRPPRPPRLGAIMRFRNVAGVGLHADASLFFNQR